MRRRREHLQVSTFPFLAVLLCAMGALVLVLLSMELKLKRAAKAKAEAEAEGIVHDRQKEHDSLVEQRNREHENKKRHVRQTWEKKRDALVARVSAEEQALDRELAEVKARLEEAARKLRHEQGGLDELRKQLEQEKVLLARQEQAVAAARREAVGAAQQVSDSDRARARLSAELARLEKALAEAVAKRKDDGRTYSVIPYFGKNGDERRPVYVECAAYGHVFHPERKTLTGRDDLRAELKMRVEEQRKAAGDKKPYVMLLVRPDKDAITRYYEMQSAARELGIDFGYEFVEADWVLEFPENGPAQPWMAGSPPAAKGDDGPKPAVRIVPKGTAIGGGTGTAGGERTGHGGGGGGAASGPSILFPMLPPSIGGERGKVAGFGSGTDAGTQPGNGTGSGDGSADVLRPPVRLMPGGPETPSSVPSKGGEGGVASGLSPFAPTQGNANRGGQGGGEPGLLSPILQAPPATLAPPRGQAKSAGPVASEDALLLPPISNKGAAGPDVQPGSLDVPAILPGSTGGQPVASAPGRGQPVATTQDKDTTPRIGPAVAEPNDGAPRQQRPRQLRPAQISGDSFLFVECKPDVVIVHPSRRQIPVEKLNRAPASNPFFLAIQQLAKARQARGGEVQVRFLIHPDGGDRTLHLAYPVLDPLKLEMRSYALQKWDDVERIVAEQQP